MVIEVVLFVCIVISIVCTLANMHITKKRNQHVEVTSSATPISNIIKPPIGTKQYTDGIDFDVLMEIITKRDANYDIHKAKLDKIYNAHRDYISLERMCLRSKFTVRDLWNLYEQVEPIELDTEPYGRVYVDDMDNIEE